MTKVYELKINPEQDFDVDAIALVEEPAIEIDFIAFSKEEVLTDKLKFSMNDDKRELIGAALIPEIRIDRINKKTNERFKVFFSANTIRQIAQNYFKKGYQNNTNINHTSIPAESYVFQSYIVDSERGINAPNGIDLPDGSWVVGVKVESEKIWEEIKSGKLKGFSPEGLFHQIEQKFSRQFNPLDELKAINERLKNISANCYDVTT